MANETDVNFDYIPKRRYIVEIKDEGTRKTIYSERISHKDTAVLFQKDLSSHKGITAKIHDTKTGEILEGDFLTGD